MKRYQPQRIDETCTHRTRQFSAGWDVSESEMMSMVKASPHKYLGPNPTHRFVEITETVVNFNIVKV